MYHVNAEGKVYKCRAKIRKCPYHIHAETREEALRLSAGMPEYGRSNYCDNKRLEIIERHGELDYENRVDWNGNMTIEGELNTLYKVLEYYNIHGWKAITKRRPTKIASWERDIAMEMWDAYGNGFEDIPTYIKEYKDSYIAESSLRAFCRQHEDRTDVIRNRADDYMTNLPIENLKNPLMISRMKIVEKWIKNRRTPEYIEERKQKIKKAIKYLESFLVADKMLNRAKFKGNRDDIVEAIRNLSDKELMGVFEDYNVTDREFEEAMKAANNFIKLPGVEYEFAIDTNIAIGRRRSINLKQIGLRKAENSVDNLLILLEAHAELERRNIHHVDIIDTRWDY